MIMWRGPNIYHMVWHTRTESHNVLCCDSERVLPSTLLWKKQGRPLTPEVQCLHMVEDRRPSLTKGSLSSTLGPWQRDPCIWVAGAGLLPPSTLLFSICSFKLHHIRAVLVEFLLQGIQHNAICINTHDFMMIDVSVCNNVHNLSPQNSKCQHIFVGKAGTWHVIN